MTNGLIRQKIGKKPKKLGQIPVDMGLADDQIIAKALASQLRIPVVRLTNAILVDAIKLKASDIHIEPQNPRPCAPV